MQVFWTPKLLNRSEIDGVVIKTYYANGSMLRRSAQLLLTPEDHHFEGSMHLRRRSNVERRDRVMVSTMGGRGDFRNTICGGNSEFLELEKFKISIFSNWKRNTSRVFSSRCTRKHPAWRAQPSVSWCRWGSYWCPTVAIEWEGKSHRANMHVSILLISIDFPM